MVTYNSRAPIPHIVCSPNTEIKMNWTRLFCQGSTILGVSKETMMMGCRKLASFVCSGWQNWSCFSLKVRFQWSAADKNETRTTNCLVAVSADYKFTFSRQELIHLPQSQSNSKERCSYLDYVKFFTATMAWQNHTVFQIVNAPTTKCGGIKVFIPKRPWKTGASCGTSITGIVRHMISINPPCTNVPVNSNAQSEIVDLSRKSADAVRKLGRIRYYLVGSRVASGLRPTVLVFNTINLSLLMSGRFN